MTGICIHRCASSESSWCGLIHSSCWFQLKGHYVELERKKPDLDHLRVEATELSSMAKNSKCTNTVDSLHLKWNDLVMLCQNYRSRCLSFDSIFLLIYPSSVLVCFSNMILFWFIFIRLIGQLFALVNIQTIDFIYHNLWIYQLNKPCKNFSTTG